MWGLGFYTCEKILLEGFTLVRSDLGSNEGKWAHADNPLAFFSCPAPTVTNT